MTWEQIDKKMQEDGWNLLVKRHYDEWTAHYNCMTAIGSMGKGKTIGEAVEDCARKLGWEDEGE